MEKICTDVKSQKIFLYAFWLNFNIHMDLVKLASMKNNDILLNNIEKAYYSRAWNVVL